MMIQKGPPSTIGYYLAKLRDGGILRLPGNRDAYCQQNGVFYRLLVPGFDENVPLFCRLKERVEFDHLWEVLRALLEHDIKIMTRWAPNKALSLLEELNTLKYYMDTKDVPIKFPDPPPKYPEGDLGRSNQIVTSFLSSMKSPRLLRWGNGLLRTLL